MPRGLRERAGEVLARLYGANEGGRKLGEIEASLAELGLTPMIAQEVDGVPAILELVAEGLGFAVLTRHAVSSSVKPSSFLVQEIGQPCMQVMAWRAISALRPITRTQQATLDLIEELVKG